MAKATYFDSTNLEGLDRQSHVEQYVAEALPTREDICNVGQGLIAETMSRLVLGGAQILTSSTAQSTVIALRKGEIVRNISVLVTTGGGTIQITQLGLYNKSDALLVSTATSTADFTATGIITCSLTNSIVIPSTDQYYPTIVSVATTPPTLLRGGNVAAGNGAVISGHRASWQQTALGSGLPATATPASTGQPFWFGIS